jgi:hypothetical protein
MRRLLTGYAVSFTRRHNRSGHLFKIATSRFTVKKIPTCWSGSVISI